MGLVARRLAQRASTSATGDRLTRLMKERGVSMASLAAAIRIQRSTLENFRDGHRDLPSEVVAAMANELGTSADFLMDRSADPRPVAAILEESRLRNEALFAELEDGDSSEADELPIDEGQKSADELLVDGSQNSSNAP
jgi:transcriptional regulator with XRE-family HTH domain